LPVHSTELHGLNHQNLHREKRLSRCVSVLGDVSTQRAFFAVRNLQRFLICVIYANNFDPTKRQPLAQ
jgi:hypothetical protein